LVREKKDERNEKKKQFPKRGEHWAKGRTDPVKKANFSHFLPCGLTVQKDQNKKVGGTFENSRTKKTEVNSTPMPCAGPDQGRGHLWTWERKVRKTEPKKKKSKGGGGRPKVIHGNRTGSGAQKVTGIKHCKKEWGGDAPLGKRDGGPH